MSESESNNTPATADALTLGVSMTGQLATSLDIDFYRFTVGAPGILSLSLDTPTSSSLDYFELGLYDSVGTLLGLHVLQRDPEGAGYQFWLDAMYNKDGAYGHQWSRGEVLVLFSESQENQDNVIELIGNGFEYLPWSE